MTEWLLNPDIWAAFVTLAVLEIVLGIDNIIFLSIISSKLPAEKQKTARFIGLALALIMRIIMLMGIAWIVGLKATLFSVGDHDVSWRDIILGLGGMFLLYKGTVEIHGTVEGDEHHGAAAKKTASFASVISQIVILDLVFSLDSVITAVGMTEHIPVMVAAICVAILIMMFASEPVSAFIQKHLSLKMLALSFLLLVGMALCADALHMHIPRGYLYFAIGFSLTVESLNLWAAANRKKKKAKA
jgi:predicted tellurium resistance membrane protein TerC